MEGEEGERLVYVGGGTGGVAVGTPAVPTATPAVPGAGERRGERRGGGGEQGKQWEQMMWEQKRGGWMIWLSI